MDLGLKGKRALVLASSRGLGRGIAESLAREGADVVLTARSADKLAVVVDAINAGNGGRAHAITADLGTDMERVHAEAVERLGGPIDVLVANTGGPPAGLALGVQVDAWSPQFEAMVLPVFRIAGLVLPAMRERGFGRILVVASSGVVQPIPNLVMSNALRSAIVGWAKTLASEVAADGVTVNIVLPAASRPTGPGNSTPPMRSARARASTRWQPARARPFRPAATGGSRSSPTLPASSRPSEPATSRARSCASTVGRSAPCERRRPAYLGWTL
jgi:3-oxoacyl-[acyl-carrier protein] reductase